MKILISFLIIFLFFCPNLLHGQNQHKLLNLGRKADAIKSQIDGGFLITSSHNNWGDSTVLTKLDSNWNIIWSNVYNIPSNEHRTTTELISSNFVTCGGNQVLSIDSAGNILWSISLDPSCTLNSIVETNDGKILVSGSLSSEGYFAKIGNEGTLLMAKTYGVAGKSFKGLGACEAANTDWLFCGQSTVSFVSGTPMIVKTNSQGDTLWTTIHDGTMPFGSGFSDASYQRITELSNGDYLAGAGHVKEGFLLTRLSSNGTILWSKVYSPVSWDFHNYYVGEMIELADGSIVIGANSINFATAPANPYVFKISSAGNLIWSSGFYNSFNTWDNWSLIEAQGGSFIFAGDVDWDTTGQYEDFNMLLIDSLGQTSCVTTTSDLTSQSISLTETSGFNVSINAVSNTSTISSTQIVISDTLLCGTPLSLSEIRDRGEVIAFPNPFSNSLEIRLPAEFTENYQIDIYNQSGQRVRCINNAANPIQISGSGLPSGLYFYMIREMSKDITPITGKLIKN
jgi:hypothetical protein